MKTQCSRCKPNTPCLSHSFLPFGNCWLESNHPLIKSYEKRRNDAYPGDQDKKALEQWKKQWPERKSKEPGPDGRYFFSLTGLTFDEAPLGYLDWLAGQSWLYKGIFRDRLFAYLKHPVIQQELENLFPDPDDDSRKPAFSTTDGYRDRWHGQCPPKGDIEEQSFTTTYSIPDDPMEQLPGDHPPTDKLGFVIPLKPTKAWQVIADFMIELENYKTELTVDWMVLKQALNQVPQATRERVLTTYRQSAYRQAQSLRCHIRQHGLLPFPTGATL